SHEWSKVELVRLQGNHDKIVLRNAEHRALDGFDAHHAIRQTVDVKLSADGIARREKFRGDVCADVSDARGAFSFRIAKKTSELDIAIINLSRVGSRAADKDVFQKLIAALHFGRSPARFGSELSNQRRVVFQIVVILERQVFVPTLGSGDRVRVFEVFERIEALDRKRFGADAGNLFVNVNVEALNQRDDRDERRHSYDHAEQSQRRAQLMRPNRAD